MVGAAWAFRDFFSESESSGVCFVVVGAPHRRNGIGSRLFQLVERHVAALGLPRATVTFEENDAGVAFARALGFEEARAETASVLDPRDVRERPPGDVDLRPVSAVDPRLVYAVDIAATQDMPALEAPDDMPFEEWSEHVLDHPMFSAEGSFVVMADGVAAALSLLLVEPGTGRALNMFTGSLPGYRGRGYALATKLASIAWAAENGVTQIATTNDETNAPMLAINKRLGYRAGGRRVEYVREETGASPAPPAPGTSPTPAS